MATDYITEDLIAGEVQTQQVKFDADTYYRGMPLEYDNSEDRYVYYGTSSSEIAGFFLEDESRAIDANGYGSIIIGGAVYEGGIVDDNGDAYTITEDIIAAWAERGFYIKRT